MKRQRGITFEKWPPLDRQSFCRAIGGGSRRTKLWDGARLSPTTIRSLRNGYGCCLAWLADHDCLDPPAPPSDRWPVAVVEAMVDEMAEGYAVATTITRVKHLKKVLTMLEPAVDLTHLDRVLCQLGRIRPARSPLVHRVSIIDLIGCGQELMRHAEENEESPSVSRALVFQTGFQVALLALRPRRSTAFCGMRLGVHLVPTASGWRMIADRDESARKRSANSEFPDVLLPALQRFLSHWRPVLCTGANISELWLRPGGQGFGAQHLHYYVSKATDEHFKFPISPKWFRKILATTIGRDHPEVVHIVGTVLGHADHATGEQVYNLADSVTAFHELASCIDDVAKPRNARYVQASALPRGGAVQRKHRA